MTARAALATWNPDDDPALRCVGDGHVQVDSAREHVARDVAADLVELLCSGAEVDGEPVCPGHVAVLVRTNKAAAPGRATASSRRAGACGRGGRRRSRWARRAPRRRHSCS